MRVITALLATSFIACAGTTPPPTVVTPAPVKDRVGYSEADVQFMQGMIGHHAQAIIMSDMVASRTSNQQMHLLAQRITISQRDEIAFMERWLTARGEDVPAADAHHHAAMGHGTLMPGMLTQEELDSLAKATGPAFDRLFLQFMIKHHEGALSMVRELFGKPSSGQQSELFVFASDVDADQRAEIRRMRALLSQLQ
jgi:uncharacterized protein (DUF305 family)